MTASREGLPPCLSYAVFDNRLAVLIDLKMDCGGQHLDRGRRFEVDVGIAGSRLTWPSHPNMEVNVCSLEIVDLLTDDPDEAQAAFERGAEWVRTGEMA